MFHSIQRMEWARKRLSKSRLGRVQRRGGCFSLRLSYFCRSLTYNRIQVTNFARSPDKSYFIIILSSPSSPSFAFPGNFPILEKDRVVDRCPKGGGEKIGQLLLKDRPIKTKRNSSLWKYQRKKIFFSDQIPTLSFSCSRYQICETSSSMTLNFTDPRTKIYKKLRGFLERKSSLRESRIYLKREKEREIIIC